jgi:hypothetical protein
MPVSGAASLELDDERVQLAFLDGSRSQPCCRGRHRDGLVRSGPEVPKARRDHPRRRGADVGSRLIEDENLDASAVAIL